MKEFVGIYGAGGYGREILPLVKQQLQSVSHEIVFVVDEPDCEHVNGISVLSFDRFLADESINKKMTIAIADCNARERLTNLCINNNIQLMNVIAKNTVIMDDVHIDEGCILSPFVCLTSNITIGKSFHANIYSYVAHDCKIGDYVTFAPGVKCNGNVIVEDFAYIGTGAIIKPGSAKKPLVIGRGAVIGMGAVVTKSVSEGTTVFGNPAKPIGR